MAAFAYTTVPGKIKPLLARIQQAGKPDGVDKKWLASVGFGAGNDPTLIPILRVIGFLDQANKTTERWAEYRDKSRAKKVLADGVREGYAELFETYSDAFRRGDDELKNFFRSKSEVGEKAITCTLATFRELCILADFSDVGIIASPIEPVRSNGAGSGANSPLKTIQTLGAGVTLNINIQLTLPESTDEAVYDRLFAALKKHLLLE